jgi:hypothetical protein
MKRTAPFRSCHRGEERPRAGMVRRLLRREEAAELLEFALILPVLLVLTVGVLDFGRAFHLEQMLNNAARVGARVAASATSADLTQSKPPPISVLLACNAVVAYLKNANVDTSFLPSSSGGCTILSYDASTFTGTDCSAAASGSSYCYGFTIERHVDIPATGGGYIVSTRVTLNYPYNWSFGFDHMIKFLAPTSSYSSTVSLTTYSIMQNLN